MERISNSSTRLRLDSGWGRGAPRDVMISIFTRLDKEDVMHAGLACTSWHKASVAPDLWTKLSFKAKSVAGGEIVRVCSLRSSATKVELHGATCVDTKLALGVGGCLGGLRHLVLRGSATRANMFTNLCQAFLRLENLKVYGTPQWTALTLSHPRLETLDITCRDFWALDLCCPHLRKVRLVSMKRQALRGNGNRGPNIGELSKSHKLWRNLGQGPFLTHIELRGVSNVDMSSWPLARLLTLTLHNCNNFISRIPNLVHVSMQNCKDTLARYWDSLERAELKHCPHELYHLRMECPSLKSLLLEGSYTDFYDEFLRRMPGPQYVRLVDVPGFNRYLLNVYFCNVQHLELRQTGVVDLRDCKLESLESANLGCKEVLLPVRTRLPLLTSLCVNNVVILPKVCHRSQEGAYVGSLSPSELYMRYLSGEMSEEEGEAYKLEYQAGP